MNGVHYYVALIYSHMCITYNYVTNKCILIPQNWRKNIQLFCTCNAYTYTNIYSIIWQKSENILESLDSTPIVILICNLVVSLKRHHILYIIASLQLNPINISDERWAIRDNNCRYISQTLLMWLMQLWLICANSDLLEFPESGQMRIKCTQRVFMG